MQELLLGEQSPSPSLSRSSSVSSVLMVSIFRLSLSSSFPVPFIIIFVIVVLLPRCHHHPRHHLCQLCHPHNLSWTEAPTTPPVKMCSRWKQCCCDWQESYSRWTTLDIWERFLQNSICSSPAGEQRGRRGSSNIATRHEPGVCFSGRRHNGREERGEIGEGELQIERTGSSVIDSGQCFSLAVILDTEKRELTFKTRNL